MFTGLVQRVGRIEAVPAGGGARLTIAHDAWPKPLEPGESVAVQGVCLTLAAIEPGRFSCDLLRETLDCSNLGAARPGTPVNLERALRVGDPMGGHIVSGHIDGVGAVRELRRVGRDWALDVTCPADIAAGIVHKGSITCDGVSLTIVRVWDSGFEVNLIPVTWEHTSLSRLKTGDAVNLEVDIIGKYVQRHLAGQSPGSSVTMETLRQSGFA